MRCENCQKLIKKKEGIDPIDFLLDVIKVIMVATAGYMLIMGIFNHLGVFV